MKVLVLPRDGNPYQELLYGELTRYGVSVRYLGRLTPSHTLNLLLLPFELAACRLGGARLVHLHWVFAFALPGGAPTRGLAQLWFGVVLRLLRPLRLRLVWTAHNVLPHRPVFADDPAARRTLVRRCDLVIAHGPATLDQLAAIGAVPSRTAVIPHGPYPAPALPAPGGGTTRSFLFFGRIEEYKGVEDLLLAFADLPGDLDVRLVVAGSCGDPALAARLRALATASERRVVLHLAHVPDEEIPGMFAAADAVVLPFRRVTTSGSALLALSHGRPLVVPALAALADLPAEAVVRYEGGVPALTGALRRLAEADAAALGTMSAAALAGLRDTGWAGIAATTHTEFRSLLEERPVEAAEPPRPPGRPRTGLRERLRTLAGDAFFRGSFLLLANTVSLAGFGFVFWALAARGYSPTAVGWLAGVSAGVNLLAAIAALGLPNTLLRHLTSAQSPRGLIKAAVAAVSVVGGVVTVVFQLFLVPLLPGFPDLARQAGAIVLITVLVVFTAVSGTLDAGLVAMRATGPLLLKNLAGSVVKVVALLLLTRFGVTGLVLAYGSGTVLACVLGGAALWPRVARAGSREEPAGLLRRYVSFSALSHLGTVLGILPSTVVPLEVLSMRGAHETAWFAVAFQVAAFLHFIPSTTAQVLFAEAQRVSLRRYLRRTLAGVYGLLVPAVAVTLLAAPYVLRIFGEGYSAGATGCLRVLALGSLLTSGNYLVDSILISRDRTRAYIFMNGANAALVLGLVALLLPHGLTGAAAGWALAQGLSLLLGAGVLVVNFATEADRVRFGLRT